MTATAVGVDVGGTFVKAVRCREDGSVEGLLQRPTPATAGDILALVGDLAATLGPGLPLGVGLAGLVDHTRGRLVWAPHLPGRAVEVKGQLTRRLSVEVAADNDANLAALAEYRHGAARGSQHAALVTLGTGIGLGLVLHGRIFRGRGHAGEVGHVTVERPGERCPCGRRGCWETKVSGRRLDADAVSVLGPGHGAEDLVAKARAGDERALGRVREAAGWLAVGVEALALSLDPDVVVLAGTASLAADLLVEPVRTRLEATEGVPARSPPAVVAGMLGPAAGAVGAALYVMEVSQR